MRVILTALVLSLLLGTTARESDYIVKEKPIQMAEVKPPIELVSRGSVEREYIFTANITAYTNSIADCGKTNGITASGKKARANHTIAMDKRFQFGTKVFIEGLGEYVVEDRGGAIIGNHIDIFFATEQEAINFGRQHRKVYIIKEDAE